MRSAAGDGETIALSNLFRIVLSKVVPGGEQECADQSQVETGDHAATVEIDGHRIRLAPRHDLVVVSDRRKHPILDPDGCRRRTGGIERGDPAVEQNGLVHRVSALIAESRRARQWSPWGSL